MLQTSFNEPSDDTVVALLAKAPGPAPWYLRKFPAFDGPPRPLEWGFDRSDPKGEFANRLHGRDQPDLVALGVKRYTTAFALAPNLLGLHFLENQLIRVVAIDPAALECVPAVEFAARAQQQRGFASIGGVLAHFTIDPNLAAGEYPLDVPLAFAGLENLLIPASYSMEQEAACAAIFEIYAGAAGTSRRLRVLPQKWFNRDAHDIGYEWITRAVRDPASGRIVGDGIRLPGAFVLAQNDCRVERWTESEPKWQRPGLTAS